MAYNDFGYPYSNPYNIMPNYQLQTNQMPRYSQMQQPQDSVICKPVASIEEARAVPTDFSGALMIMPDHAHGMIYTKQLNFADGNPVFKVYKHIPEPEKRPETVDSAPSVEFAPLSIVEALQAKIERLEAMIATTTEKPRGNTTGGLYNRNRHPDLSFGQTELRTGDRMRPPYPYALCSEGFHKCNRWSFQTSW